MTVQPPVEPGGAAHGAVPWSPTVVGEVAEVIANDAVNLEYRHLVVRCSAVAASAVPGQFFQLLCPHSEGAQPFLRRPIRSAAWPNRKMPIAMPAMVTAVQVADWARPKPKRVER